MIENPFWYKRNLSIFIDNIISSVDKKYSKQLLMFYIQKIIKLFYVEASEFQYIFSQETFTTEDIVSIIKHIYESTEPSEEIIKFAPLMTRVPLLGKITDSMTTFKSLIPQRLLPASRFKGHSVGSLALKPDTPEKIRSLYEKYNHMKIIDNTQVVSRI